MGDLDSVSFRSFMVPSVPMCQLLRHIHFLALLKFSTDLTLVRQ